MLDETEIETIPRAQPVKMTITDHDGEPTADDTLEQKLRASVKKGAAISARGGNGSPVAKYRRPVQLLS
jgi:hypothetical protein